MRRWRPFGRRVTRRTAPFADLPDHHKIRMCFGKRMLNKQQAIQLVAHMKKEHGAGETMGYYKCEYCRSFHVGRHESNRRKP